MPTKPRKVGRIIRRAAARHRIDPWAAIAVARGEGGLRNRAGDIGDLAGGGSYGPFQLYAQGALPARFRGNPQAADAWAWSPQGINYAIRQMAKAGAAGLTGAQAVEAIIRKFERPADPDSSVANALERYKVFDQGALAPSPRQAAAPATDERRQWGLETLQDIASGSWDPLKVLSQYAAMQRKPPAKAVRQATVAARQESAPGLVLGGKYQMGGGPEAHGSRALGNWQSDRAWDLMAPAGTPVYAIYDGHIATGAGFGFSTNGSTVWGHKLTLEGSGNAAFYTHLGGFAPGIKPGARIKKGQLLGWLGSPPGFPSHLHLGLQNGDLSDYL